MSSRSGRSYMTGTSNSSKMARRPRAPVLRSKARSATASRASGSKTRSAPSIEKSCWYCLTRLLRGSVSTRTSDSRSRLSTVATTGRRPMNSGIRPNFTKSSGRTWEKRSTRSRSAWVSRLAPKPTPFLPTRSPMTFSRPANAPATMKSTLDVSSWMNSWFGCLRPPCGGMAATVPSRIFNSACCTPSPETSRVIDGLSPLREILSISST